LRSARVEVEQRTIEEVKEHSIELEARVPEEKLAQVVEQRVPQMEPLPHQVMVPYGM
jgi:hypothetical protein